VEEATGSTRIGPWENGGQLNVRGGGRRLGDDGVCMWDIATMSSGSGWNEARG
jgi:hypothetical protein